MEFSLSELNPDSKTILTTNLLVDHQLIYDKYCYAALIFIFEVVFK